MELLEEDVARLQEIMREFDYTQKKVGRVRTRDLLTVLRLAGKNPANDETEALSNLADPDD